MDQTRYKEEVWNRDEVRDEDYVMAPSPSTGYRLVAAFSCLAMGIFCLHKGFSEGSQLWQVSVATRMRAPVATTNTHQMGQRERFFQRSQNLETSKYAAPVAASGSALWNGDATLGSVAALGCVLGAGLVALFQKVSQSHSQPEESWSMAAVADANLDMNLKTVQVPTGEHLPPWAGSEPFRPDLFQPNGKAGTIVGTDIPYVKRRTWWFPRSFNGTDVIFIITTFSMHAIAFILGPMTYRPDCLALAAVMYVITGMLGITLSFHRQLSHRSFTTPKWLEYFFAYCGVLALQGDPLEWVSSHRYHHLYCETDRDPHTVNEGLWWSHMGWLLDNTATKARTGDQSNANDIAQDPFYSFIKKTYPLHPLLFACAMYAWGGLPYVVWGVAVRTVWVWHITWFVNSASHAWGSKVYKTNPPDQSRNNWWVGILAFGEGWHNNHHAFQYSARHGLEWWQIDMTWYLIRTLQFLGLATNVKLPTEAKKAAMRLA